jgi:hypothetical protein
MTDNQKGGIALIVGAIGGLVTMAMHPTGGGVLTPAQYERFALMNIVAHSLAIASSPISFLGALALTRQLQSPDRFSISALVMYGFAIVAGMMAATASGFIATPLVAGLTPAASEVNHALYHYTGLWNQAFARILAVASSVAILLWSLAILRNRALSVRAAYYGIPLGIIIVLLVASGSLKLDLHGFGLVMILQSVWFISVGTLMIRLTDRPIDR